MKSLIEKALTNKASRSSVALASFVVAVAGDTMTPWA